MLSISKAIAQCPRSMFGKKGIQPPNYPGIFAAVAKALLTDAGVKFSEATVDAVSEIINPSTLQRQIAQRREALTGKWNGDGYDPIPEKVAKVKAPLMKSKAAGEKGAKVKAVAALDKLTKKRKAGKGKNAAQEGGTVAKLKVGIKKPVQPAKAPKKAAPVPVKGKKSAASLDDKSALAKARAALAAKGSNTPAPAAERDPDDVI